MRERVADGGIHDRRFAIGVLHHMGLEERDALLEMRRNALIYPIHPSLRLGRDLLFLGFLRLARVLGGYLTYLFICVLAHGEPLK
jgi:hypothetical protein